MQFESNHSFFKDIIHRVRCFKNIPKTLAHHHQRLLCLEANSERDGTLLKDAVTGPGRLYLTPGM